MQVGGGKHVSILKNTSVYNNKFKIESSVFSFKFKKNLENLPFEDFIVGGFDEILTHARLKVLPHHLMGVKINVLEGITTGPVGLSFRKPDEVTGEMLLGFVIFGVPI